LTKSFNRAESTGAYTPLQDALGSVIGLVDASGNLVIQYAYDPFGNTTASGAVNANQFQYTGRENEGDGLYFYRARYYSPLLGRFINEDPLGFAGSGPISTLTLGAIQSISLIPLGFSAGICGIPEATTQTAGQRSETLELQLRHSLMLSLSEAPPG